MQRQAGKDDEASEPKNAVSKARRCPQTEKVPASGKVAVSAKAALADKAGKKTSRALRSPPTTAGTSKPPAAADSVPAKADPAKPTKEALFLRAIHSGACGPFGTVLGPEANDPHRNHFHLDLIPRRSRGYCE